MINMRLWFGAVLLVLATAVHPACASEDIGQQWLDLWSRCRIAVETGKNIDASGLDDLGLVRRTQAPLMAGKDVTFLAGYDYAEQSWGREGNRFVIRETEIPTDGGTVRRICNVQFEDADHVVTDDEIVSVSKAFMDERKRLRSLGRHEVRDPDRIWPVALGVGPVANNPNGCRVISAVLIQFDPNNDKAPRYFSSFSGEQALRAGCESPALLKLKE